MSRYLKLFGTLLFALLLAGCATQGLKPVANKARAWQHYQKQWQMISSWRAKGQMSLMSPQQALMSNFQWQSHYSAYKIKVYGALGIGQVVIALNAQGKIQYTTAYGKKYQARSAKALMQRQLGWSVPIEGFAYWVRGLPAPGAPVSQKAFNEYGLLSQLQQDGWSMRYFHYIKDGGLIYPTRVVVVGHRLRIVVALNQLRPYTAH